MSSYPIGVVLFTLLTLITGLPAAMAAEPCAEPIFNPVLHADLQATFESVCEVKFNADSCTQYFENQLGHIRDAQEKITWVKKLSSCRKEDRDLINQVGVSSMSCLKGLKDGAVDLVTGLPRALLSGLESSAECKHDIAGKKERLEAFNSFLDPTERLALSENELQSASCPEFVQKLRRHGTAIEMQRLSEYHRTGNKTVMERRAPDYNSANEQVPSLWQSAQEAVRDLGIRSECYTPEARSELYCDMVMLSAGSLIAGSAGPRLLAAARLARLTGKTPEEISKLAEASRKLGHQARVQRAVDSGAGKLKPLERTTRSAELIGRKLTSDQEKGLLALHQIGRSEGRGFGTLEYGDISKKYRGLLKLGFTPNEARILIYNGMVGDLPAASGDALAALQSYGIQARDTANPNLNLNAFSNDLYQLEKRALPDLKKGGDAASRAQNAISAKFTELLSLRSVGQTLSNSEVDGLYRLHYFGNRTLESIPTAELLQIQKSMVADFEKIGVPKFGNPELTHLQLEKELIKNIDKHLGQRPDLQAARSQGFQQASQQVRANQIQSELSMRTNHTNPAAHPLTTEQNTALQDAVQKLADPSKLTPQDMARLQELRKAVRAKQEFHEGTLNGIMAPDRAAVERLESAWNQAAAATRNRQGSIQHLANEQGRTLSPMRVEQNRIPVGGGAMTRDSVVSTYGANIASSDFQKISDALRRVDSTTVTSPLSQDARFLPILQSRADFEALYSGLSRMGITQSELQAANVLTVVDSSSLARMPAELDYAKSLLHKLNQSDAAARQAAAQGWSQQQSLQVRHLIQTLQAHVSNFVPSHQLLDPFGAP